MSSRRAALLDRDGVLNERAAEHRYIRSPEAFRWLPGAPEALTRLARAGYLLIVVSNQRGIARGLVSWDTVRAIERLMQADLQELGASFSGFYYCPHELEQACDCRKPSPGLLRQAAAEHGIELEASVMIGDSESDVSAGRAAGCTTVLVGGESPAADLCAPNLAAAAELITSGGFPVLPRTRP